MSSKEQKIEELLTRGVAEVIDRTHLKERLLEGTSLRIKLGIDPTSSHIHLGRAVVLLKLRDFQELGHKIVLIVGDFTGVIGDASDKESERPMLSTREVEKNMKTYTEQIGRIIDLDKAEVRYNSVWLTELGYEEIGMQANAFSLAEFIGRENIKKRLDEGKRVSLREVLYPLMQGYDSIAVNADVELGGTDQRFNLLSGRRLQEAHGQKAQDILMTDLILGTDGRKMSSSWGNTINLLDTPDDMFGKVMSIPDELIVSYFVHCTRLVISEVKKMETALADGTNPRDVKVKLAKEIVALYHSAKEAAKAETYFVETFSKGYVPQNVREVRTKKGVKLVDMLTETHLAKSKSDARRKIEQGGVEIADERIRDVNAKMEERFDKQVMRVGKKDFVRIVY
ncbi:MAG: tyrosine--tRNA ligase [Candidatus Moranbacteria bacterium]|nr:tyrosine--tRNA ligase [Candidatus Moranbacteria bacterium]